MTREATAQPAPAPRASRPTTVLVIEDEPQIRRVVRAALEDEATSVLDAGTGADGIALCTAERPDVIVLDLGLPDTDGEAVCRALRQRTPAPIVVLSARHSEAQKVALLDAGADDYVTKPFGSEEFRARIRAQVRRASGGIKLPTHAPIVLGSVTLDFEVPAAARDAQSIHLTRTEWDLLRTLVEHDGRTMTHAQLFRAVWGNVSGDAQQYLRVYVRSLRRKLEDDPVRPRLILTEPGVGYRFERPTAA
jgi:two-component system KDP operon response regulator KdpE